MLYHPLKKLMVWVPCFSRYPCIAHKGLGQTADPPKLPGGRWHRGLRRSWPYPWGIDIENILSIKSSWRFGLSLYIQKWRKHGDVSGFGRFFFHQQSTLDTAISNALLIGNE